MKLISTLIFPVSYTHLGGGGGGGEREKRERKRDYR